MKLVRVFPLFSGNCPHNVSKDAKYVVTSGKGGAGPQIQLSYIDESGDRLLATTQAHPDLVDMVNEVKVMMGSSINGPFYINEFSQVIVPVGDENGSTYYLAGEYDLPLRFRFKDDYVDYVLSGEGVDLQGKPLKPGDPWVGPHPGIPYILEPGGADIRYESYPRPNVKRQVRLSAVVGKAAAAEMGRRILAVKSWQGGRFYINEWQEIFAPVNQGGVTEYFYVCHLEEDDPWFAKP